MKLLSKDFKLSEFQCKCGKCYKHRPKISIVIMLQMLRLVVACLYDIGSDNVRIVITSGNRCKSWNKLVGGQKFSKHLTWKAADIKVYKSVIEINGKKHWTKLCPEGVGIILDENFPNSLGIGIYKHFTHIDTRDEKARWKVK